MAELSPAQWGEELHAQFPSISARVFAAWVANEGEPGRSQNNPMNIPYPGLSDAQQTSGNAFYAFPTPAAGAAFTINFLKSNSFYANILRVAANGGSDLRVIQEIGKSPWATSHYMNGGCGWPGCSLWAIYQSMTGVSSSTTPGKSGPLAGTEIWKGKAGQTQLYPDIPNTAQGLAAAAAKAFDPLAGVSKGIATLFNRATYVLVGSLLMLMGLYLMEHERINTAGLTVAAPELSGIQAARRTERVERAKVVGRESGKRQAAREATAEAGA